MKSNLVSERQFSGAGAPTAYLNSGAQTKLRRFEMLTQTKIALAAALILSAAGVAQAATGSGTTGFIGSNMSPAPWATARSAPAVNPSNPQDMTNRGNLQNMTLPRASNPQNLVR
jgi:hypothetical protein